MAEPDLVISAGFSDAQLVREANKVVAMYAKKGEEAQKAFQDAQGRVTMDFNQGYNPPCAFTSFATCPLPPAQNRLDLAIDAGEKAYAGEHGS